MTDENYCLGVIPDNVLPKTPAERLAFIHELASPHTFEEDGALVTVAPLISADEARRLLERPYE